MADLIIQPKNDDHLKLNNDAGTTILELANDESKLRLAQNNISASDGTTAITTSGANVTLAGTANNIGTVTSGTLSHGTTLQGYVDVNNTGVTFPAGHVIQTVYTSYNTLNSTNSTTTNLTKCVDSGGVNRWTATINNVLESSYVLIISTFVGGIYRAHTEVAGAFGFLRESDVICDAGASSNFLQINATDQSYWNAYNQITLMFLDTTPGTGTNNYFVGSKSDGTSTVTLYSDANYEPFRMLLQEIKQG